MPLPSDPKRLALSHEVLEAFDNVNGGEHPGFRPAHAKGILVSGAFKASPDAPSLTHAPHARGETPVTCASRTLLVFPPSPTTTAR
jgi:catalase